MSEEPQATAQETALEQDTATEEPSNAREMSLGKLKVTDGRVVSYCQWTVVGAGGQWAYSAIMPLSSGTNHRIVMGNDPGGGFRHEAYADTREEALAAVRARIMAFLKRQPRWRVIE